MTVDYSGIRWWIMIVGAADHRLIAAGLPDIQYSIPQFIAAKTLILIMFSFTLDIDCTSVHPGRGMSGLDWNEDSDAEDSRIAHFIVFSSSMKSDKRGQ